VSRESSFERKRATAVLLHQGKSSSEREEKCRKSSARLNTKGKRERTNFAYFLSFFTIPHLERDQQVTEGRERKRGIPVNTTLRRSRKVHSGQPHRGSSPTAFRKPRGGPPAQRKKEISARKNQGWKSNLLFKRREECCGVGETTAITQYKGRSQPFILPVRTTKSITCQRLYHLGKRRTHDKEGPFLLIRDFPSGISTGEDRRGKGKKRKGGGQAIKRKPEKRVH